MLAVGTAIALAIGVPQLGRFSNCSMGVTGTAASMTLRGWGANCGKVVNGQTGAAQLLYLIDHEQSAIPIVCQRPVNGLTFTVHDEGQLKLVGNAICAGIHPDGSFSFSLPTVAPPAASSPLAGTSASKTAALVCDVGSLFSKTLRASCGR